MNGAGETGPSEITQLVHEAGRGNKEAFNELLPLVYEELKGLARRKLRFEREGHTLNTTAVVHEAYLRLVDREGLEWQSRSHFFAIAAQAMRRILIDYAKMRGRERRGGGAPHVSLDVAGEALAADVFSDDQATDLLAFEDALHRLAAFNERGARVVEYRFFGGLSHREIAEVLGVSEVTVRRSWTVAKTWLRREMGGDFSFRAGAPVTDNGGQVP